MIRANDENNDWIYGIGANAYKKENAGIAQDIKTRLQEWKGDCFFELEAGVDWLNRFSDGNKKLLIEECRSIILKTEGVVNVVFIDSFLNGRDLTLNYTVQTIYTKEIQDTITL